jgi:hypothetical protein
VNRVCGFINWSPTWETVLGTGEECARTQPRGILL